MAGLLRPYPQSLLSWRLAFLTIHHLFNPSGLCHVAMMEWKPVLLPVFLAAGLVITGLSTPASADQGRGGWGRNDQPRGDIKPRRFEPDAARRALLDGPVLPFSILQRR